MTNQVSTEQGVQNLIDSEGNARKALAHAQAKLWAYRTGSMRNASDAAEAVAWYEKVESRLRRLVLGSNRKSY